MARDKTAPRIRCAIYTRKSSEEGLEQEFNSLDAQREAAEAYVASQRHEGWTAIKTHYDDGGYSGGNTERPGVQKLFEDIEAGLVDCVVVYKVDRLSRSLLDFAKIIELFEQHDVSFVSVTQQFNTTSSMGRLTLNILLSFAQFEREIIGERIRDKIAAAKRKGKHCGGMPILGYDVDREKMRLIINKNEAKLVRHIFKRFTQMGSATKLAKELNAKGVTTKAWKTNKGHIRGGSRWNKAHLYRLLNNRKYIGEVVHKDTAYPGEHDAIVTRSTWNEAHKILATNHRTRGNHSRSETPALLKGLVSCGNCGCSMGITFTKKKRTGALYRYYLCVQASKKGYDSCPVKTVAAGEIEKTVMDQLKAVFRSPEMVVKTFKTAARKEAELRGALRKQRKCLEEKLKGLRADAGRMLKGNGHAARSGELAKLTAEIETAEKRLASMREELRRLETQPVSDREVAEALKDLGPAWQELFPAEQARIVQLLIDGVVVNADGLDIRMRASGLRSLAFELKGDAAV